MKTLLKIIFFTLLFSSPLISQELFLCKSYTEAGEPIDASLEWKIDPSGTNLFILFKNNREKITGTNLFLFLDKKFRGVYNPFDSKIVPVMEGKNWVYLNYLFTEEGEYEIYVMDLAQNRLAETKIKITYDYAAHKDDITDIYYEANSLVFCERVINGKPINTKRSISLSEGGSLIYIFLKSDEPLRTEILLLNVWRKKSRYDYNEFIEVKKYKVDPNWKDTFFKYKFSEPGNYKVSIYNENDLLIKNGYILVYE